jgi:hypothetical protein
MYRTDSPASFGRFTQTGTPVAIIERLHRETSKIIAMPDVNKKVNDLGLLLLGNTPAEFAVQIRAETNTGHGCEEAGIQRIVERRRSPAFLPDPADVRARALPPIRLRGGHLNVASSSVDLRHRPS